MTDDVFRYHTHLEPILADDLNEIMKKDLSYGASWKKRGGVGAFMMVARKWDRLENALIPHYDIFRALESQKDLNPGTDGTVLAEIRDLRRYLLLIEAEAMTRGYCPEPEHK